MAAAAPYRSFGIGRAFTTDNAAIAGEQSAALRQGSPGAPSSEGGPVVVASARIDNRNEPAQLPSDRLGLLDGDPSAKAALAAYLASGTGFAGHLTGDYAIVVWDEARRRLIAARDPMGMRPLYYRVAGSAVAFASEVKQILALGNVTRSINVSAVAYHLAGWAPDPAETFYEGVNQVPPGHTVVLEPGRITVDRHWDLDPGPRIRHSTEDAYADLLRELFLQAVEDRALAGDTLGVLLSGGVDSTAVASAAGWMRERGRLPAATSIHAFSWRFAAWPECDEREISGPVVARYGLHGHDVAADEAWPLCSYPQEPPDADDPHVGHYDALVRRAGSQAAGAGVSQLFSGGRGDVMIGTSSREFLGYLRRLDLRGFSAELRRAAEWSGLARHRVLSRWGRRVLRDHVWPPWRAPRSRRLAMRLSGRSISPPYPPWISPDLAAAAGLRDPEHDLGGPRAWDRRWRYQEIMLPDQHRAAAWLERTLARFGVGFADPWSDTRIAEFALAVPQQILNRAGEQKRLARLAMRGVIPDPIRIAARKIYPTPMYRDVIVGRARQTVEDLLSDPEMARREFVRADLLRRQYEAMRRGEQFDPDIWPALTLEMWLRAHW